MNLHRAKSNSPSSNNSKVGALPFFGNSHAQPLSKSSRRLHQFTPSSSRVQNDFSVTPEVAALVVRQYLIPLFETENKAKKGLVQIPGVKEELVRPLEVVSNTVYGELKLVDSLLSEYTEVKKELDEVSQSLKDTEQEKASVLSELENVKGQYSAVSQEIQRLQQDTQNSLRGGQSAGLKMALLNGQLTEYKKLYALSEAENKHFLSALHEEKALNDKRRNISDELEHGNELLKMENDIMAERLTGLYSEFKTLSERRFLEDKLVSETDSLAASLKELALFCDSLSIQLMDALSEREQLRAQHEEIEVLTEEIKLVRDKLMSYSREAIAGLQKELASMIEQREDYKAKQSKLEKNYKDLADAYEKLRSRLKQWKARGRNFKDNEEKICSKCRQAYSEKENFHWSCKTHGGTYSANSDMWWCCGKKHKDTPGCLPSKHVSKEEEEEEEDELAQAKQDTHLRYYNMVCPSCKETGHRPHECPKDPNIRTVGDPTEDDERIEEIRKRKKPNVNNIEISQKVVGMLGARLGDSAFGEPTGLSEGTHFKEILNFKRLVRDS